ncbi:MAG TPA: fibronectin type III domain-containing protein [Roseimicrobium sp.]|nr:fibronectin type III domain-containing protein [Roseimicrobium sp.]
MMSGSGYESVAIVTDIHARSVESGYLVVMQSTRGGHGVTPREQNAPSHAPARAPSAGVNRNVIPPAITNVLATPLSSNTIELTWTKAHRATDTIVVDYATDGVSYATVGMLQKNQTRFTLSSLESGKTYSFKLYAMNGKGMSAASEIVSTVLG